MALWPFRHEVGEGRERGTPIMTSLRDFTVAAPRSLPVLILADVSGSMAKEGKIDVLNRAVAEMIQSFATEDATRAEIQVGVITFGGAEARSILSLRSAGEIEWVPLEAGGKTPLGSALTLVTDLMEDPDRIPSRSYRPTLVLVSDGRPTDTWDEPLRRLLDSGRASKAARFALAIGADADRDVLEAFIGEAGVPVFEAHQVRQIEQFFIWVTMSVAQRVRSANPDSVVAMEPPSLDDFEF